MKSVYHHKEAFWIDLESPTPSEVAEAAKSAGLEAQQLEELLSPSLKHKVEFGDNHAYLILHFPAFGESKNDDTAYEIDFILTKNVLITTHYEKVESVHKFKPEENDEPELFFGLFGELLGNFEQKLTSIDHWVRDIEKKMFSGHEKQTIFELSEASKHLIDFRKITSVYPEVLEALATDGSKVFGKKFAESALAMKERFLKSKTKLDMLFETVHELRETNNALVSTKQNESMKTLTWVTAITSIIVGISLIWLGIEAIR
jgi:Mg2+ and Co2+ transporter CorA